MHSKYTKQQKAAAITRMLLAQKENQREIQRDNRAGIKSHDQAKKKGGRGHCSFWSKLSLFMLGFSIGMFATAVLVISYLP
ncbi:MAG TPA: hypothetical protein ENJ33_04015 [Thiothrix sp.]|nr:hypothetical protein [Thiothrix sp.]